jgi:hypothetical protein
MLKKSEKFRFFLNTEVYIRNSKRRYPLERRITLETSESSSAVSSALKDLGYN